MNDLLFSDLFSWDIELPLNENSLFDPNTSDLNTPFGNVNDNSFFELFPHEKHTVLHTLHNPPFVRPTAAQSLIQEPTPTKQKQKKPKAPHATASPSGGVNGGRVKKRKTKRKKLPVDPNAPPKPKRNTGLNKPLILSSSLSVIMDGATELSRPEIVKRLWNYIKSNELQDPADRRFILCDAKLKIVFNQDRVNSFVMNRDLTAHLTKKEEPPKQEPKEEPSALIEDFSPLTMVETPDIETPTDDFLKWSIF